MKALVVDDDITSRIVLQEILADYAEVHTCTDGTEAVEACRRALERGRPYGLILLDIWMPAMSGLEALKLIRAEEQRRGLIRPRAAKVVITSAADDQNSISSAFQELCDAYVVKPVDSAELLNLVQYLCPIAEIGADALSTKP